MHVCSYLRKVVNEVCALLPKDGYTDLRPVYILQNNTFQYEVRLPYIARCARRGTARLVVQGECLPTLKQAKRSAALKAVQELYRLGVLNVRAALQTDFCRLINISC